MSNCQKDLGKPEMDISLTRNQHQQIIARLMNGPGDSEGAMHKAERMFGLSYWCQHTLRHKGRASLSFMQRVHAAYVATIERSVRRDLETLKLEKAKDDADADLAMLIAQAESLLTEIASRKAAKEGAK